ncbi:MAG TPA: aldo/keto reductase [Pseudonocardiaceae bacterium]|jgi:D-threo-aldose 1-dehydrogenase|nr:aldo/keto reductase [Pseudonocardiaceae bacterium]
MGFGAAVIGNLYTAVDPDVAAKAVHAALRSGVRYFDTAPHYGLGLSEQRLGAGLAGFDRAGLLISTKVGRLLVDDPAGANERDAELFDVPADKRRVLDYSRDGVLRSLEASLDRLGADRIDVVYVHDPDEHYEEALRGAFPALTELRDQGVIGGFGAGMNSPAMLADFVRETELDVVMLAGRYTLLDQAALTELLPLCTERGVSMVAAGVFNSGLLALDRPGSAATYDYAPAPEQIVQRANRIADVCLRHGVSLPQAAVQFPRNHPAVATVCLGARTAQEVERNAALFDRPVPLECWQELVAEGLLAAEVPMPTGANA